MLITAGVHAGEYVGIQAAIELAQKLKIEKVTGTVIIIKALNRPAFEARKGSMGLTDGKNLNREFPGNPDGTEIIFNEDYFGNHRGIHPLAGPFAGKEEWRNRL